MAKCTFLNLSPEQAEVLASWYEGQGEQNAEDWFAEQGLPAAYTDGKQGYYKILDNGDVEVYCKSVDLEEE